MTEVTAISLHRNEVLFLALLAAAFLLHAVYFNYTVDDAYISFRYAANWVAGDGLVYNPGERVEGYTNFLWTALSAAALRLGADQEDFARWAGLLAGMGCLIFSYGELRRRISPHPLLFLLPISLAANGVFVVWSGAGLETSLFAFLMLAGTMAAAGREDSRSIYVSAVLFAVATLTRPEGAFIFVIVALDRFFFTPGSRGSVIKAVLLFGALTLPFELLRHAYYGEWLPNTWYAKSGGGPAAFARGLRYLGNYFGPFGGWTMLAPLPLIFFIRLREWERTVLIVLFAYFAYIVLIGGDGLPYFRFVAPVLPLLAMLAVSGLCRLYHIQDGISLLRVALFAILLALPIYSSFRGETYQFLVDDRLRIELHWKVIGKWLAETGAPGETIAVTTAGAIPYFSGLPTVDMLGITDKHIARRKMPEMGSGIAGHEKHDMAYVLSKEPTYLLHYTFLLPEPVFTTGQFRSPWNPGLEELLQSEEFNRDYRGESAQIGKMYVVYFKRVPADRPGREER